MYLPHNHERHRAIATAILLILFIAAWCQGQEPSAATREPPAPTSESVAVKNEPDAIPAKSLLQVIRDGGPMMLPIAGCSFLLCVFIFERLVSLRRGRILPAPFMKRFLEQLRENQLDRETALELCNTNRSPVSVIFAAAVKKWGRPSVEVEQSVLDAGERVTMELRKYLRLFNGIATISPMLGLLGTVFGMIRSFNAIASSDAMGRPELLAEGIGEALLTTAAGLCVAVPALVAYWMFVARVDRLIVLLDASGQEVVDLVAADSWLKEQLDDGSRNRKRLKAA